MPYIKRNEDNVVIGTAAMPQDSWEKEFLFDDHADILLFVNPPVTWDDIRTERNIKLAASDWTGLTDTVLSSKNQTQWRDYRTLLRDVPQNFETPDNVTWPSEPNRLS